MWPIVCTHMYNLFITMQFIMLKNWKPIKLLNYAAAIITKYSKTIINHVL